MLPVSIGVHRRSSAAKGLDVAERDTSMNQTLTIAKREVASLFFSPIAYVVAALFAFVAAFIFLSYFNAGAAAELRPVLGHVVWLLVFIVPAISMRLLSEEFRTGAIEPLVTAPLSDAQIIVGKWLGALGFFAVLLLPLVVFAVVLACTASPDFGPILTGLLGVLLVGGLYLAIGALASALTQNQIIAFLLTVFITGVLTIVMYYLGAAEWMPPWLKPVVFYLNVDRQFEDFARGLLDTSRLTYFGTGIALFLFLAVKVLESRRWR
jgi:ABC-2 type transport system permease protein